VIAREVDVTAVRRCTCRARSLVATCARADRGDRPRIQLSRDRAPLCGGPRLCP
jgi:hypothetical protein